MKPENRAYLFALGAVALWSTVASAFELALRHLGPAQLLLIATAVASATLAALLAAGGRLGELRRTTAGELARSALLALLSPFGYYLVLLAAYERLPGQEAQPLNFSWGIVLPLLSIPLLGQRIRPLSLLALLISLAGVYVIATRGDFGALRFADPLGVALATGSSILWALFWIFSVRDRRDELIKLFLSFSFGFLFTLIYTAAIGQLTPPPLQGALGAAYAGLFELGITYVLWLQAMKLCRSTAQISNLIFLAPFLSLILLSQVAGETIHPSSIAGLALIVTGILLQRALASRRTSTPENAQGKPRAES